MAKSVLSRQGGFLQERVIVTIGVGAGSLFAGSTMVDGAYSLMGSAKM
jgi:hypothetical protein